MFWPTLVTWPALGTKVSQVRQEYVPQARQVSEVGQDTQVKQVPRYTIKTRYTIRISISVHYRNHI